MTEKAFLSATRPALARRYREKAPDSARVIAAADPARRPRSRSRALH